MEPAKQQEWAELKVEISPQGSRLFRGWELLRAFGVGTTAHLSKPQLSLERSSPPLLGVRVWGRLPDQETFLGDVWSQSQG